MPPADHPIYLDHRATTPVDPRVQRKELFPVSQARDFSETIQTRTLAVMPFWFIVLTLLCAGCGPSSRPNSAQGTKTEPPQRGSVFGVVFNPQQIVVGVDKSGVPKFRLDPKRGAWAHSDGQIVPADHCRWSDRNVTDTFEPIRFKTDAQGRFRVDHVPVGRVAIQFKRGSHIVLTESRIAYVLDGQSTEARFLEPSEAWNVTYQFVIGDGSQAQFLSGTGMGAERKVVNVTNQPPSFRVDLQPKEDKPVSFGDPEWHSLDDRHRILLRDIHPGEYHAVIGGWLLSIGVRDILAEQDIDVQPGHAAFSVRLGAGCITGAVHWSKQFRYMVHVLAVGKKSHAVRHARCDNGGNFCVRYLDPDAYVLFAHDYDAGWCRIGEVAVANNISDVGTHKLVPGGAISVRLPVSVVRERCATVVATDSQGFAIDWPAASKDSVETRFTISSLWPGKWTVAVRNYEKATRGQNG
jgi:hypothetical protein